MLASSEQRSHKHHVYERNGVDLLKAAAIYGANGAGKSNLVKALAALKMLVLAGGKGTLKELRGFKLGRNEDKPINIEIEFIAKGTPFLYGLSCERGLVDEEWLYVSGLGETSDRLLFNRKTINGELQLSFADEYISTPEGQFRLKFYQDEFLKENELLFTELANLKEGFDEVKLAFEWFKENILIVFTDTRLGPMSWAIDTSKFYKKFMNETICSLHTGIKEIEISQSDLKSFLGKDNESFADSITKKLRMGEPYVQFTYSGGIWKNKKVVAVLENGNPVVRSLITKHHDEKGQPISFSHDEESDGTNRLLDFVPAFFAMIHTDTVVIIDEIDQSIHPALLKELVRKFMDNQATKGQLIFTTHESNLLDQSILRRDEIWFVEKHEGATQLYPLSDFDIRSDLDIRKGYLNGRFGAIPFLGNLKDLNWEQYAKA